MGVAGPVTVRSMVFIQNISGLREAWHAERPAPNDSIEIMHYSAAQDHPRKHAGAGARGARPITRRRDGRRSSGAVAGERQAGRSPEAGIKGWRSDERRRESTAPPPG